MFLCVCVCVHVSVLLRYGMVCVFCCGVESMHTQSMRV